MLHPPLILLASATDLIVPAIFLVIWVFVIVISFLQKIAAQWRKRQEMNQPQRMPRPIQRTAPPRVPKPPVRPARQSAAARPSQPVPPQPIPAAVAPPALPAASGNLSAQRMQAEIGSAEAAQAGKTAPAVNAAGLSRSLHGTHFRKLYILTELLQPPVALREPK